MGFETSTEGKSMYIAKNYETSLWDLKLQKESLMSRARVYYEASLWDLKPYEITKGHT